MAKNEYEGLSIGYISIGRLSVYKDKKRIYAICDLYKRYIRSIYNVWKNRVRKVLIKRGNILAPLPHKSNFSLYSRYILT